MKKIVSLVLMFFAVGCFIFEEYTNKSIITSNCEAAIYREVESYHILVPTEKQALSIRQEINEGKTDSEIFSNFKLAARKYSQCPSGKSGGYLGWYGRGMMVRSFERAAFELPVNEVSEPVKTDFGWHLIYNVAKR